jgi:hypothetical protein
VKEHAYNHSLLGKEQGRSLTFKDSLGKVNSDLKNIKEKKKTGVRFR